MGSGAIQPTRPNNNDASASQSHPFHQVYPQLRRLAASWLRERRQHAGPPGATQIEPTMLVHEAWVKLAKSMGQVDPAHPDAISQTHFFALAARAMRQILVDHARKRMMLRRKIASGQRVTLSGVAEREQAVDVLSLHEALEKLEKLNPVHAQIVELRYFAGMRIDDVARMLNQSPRSLDAQWAGIRAWLEAELRGRERAP